MSKTVWADLPSQGARLRKLRLVMLQFVHGAHHATNRADVPQIRGGLPVKTPSSLKQRLETFRSVIGARL